MCASGGSFQSDISGAMQSYCYIYNPLYASPQNGASLMAGIVAMESAVKMTSSVVDLQYLFQFLF